MARKRKIRRTTESTIIRYEGIEVTSKEIFEGEFETPGAVKETEVFSKAREVVESESVKVISIISVEHKKTVRAMTLEQWLTYSTIENPEEGTGVAIEEGAEID